MTVDIRKCDADQPRRPLRNEKLRIGSAVG